LLGGARNSSNGTNHVQLAEQGILLRSTPPTIKENTDDDEKAFGSIRLPESEEESRVATSLEMRGTPPSAQDYNSTYNIVLVDEEPDVL